MKHFFLCCLLLFTAIGISFAQDFITRGKIEFEVKRNTKHMPGISNNGDNPFQTSLPEFDISYYDLLFSWNQSIYQPGRKGSVASMYVTEESAYMDLNTQQSIQKYNLMDDYFVFADSIRKVKWKIGNETRKIAGWECRKAIGIINDNFYVVAFYCPEIISQGGPELFSGLPGMILGLAIPRYYTTWFATKIEIADIDESKIKPPVVAKKKQYSKRELAEIILKKYKDNGWWSKETVEDIIQILTSYTLD